MTFSYFFLFFLETEENRKTVTTDEISSLDWWKYRFGENFSHDFVVEKAWKFNIDNACAHMQHFVYISNSFYFQPLKRTIALFFCWMRVKKHLAHGRRNKKRYFLIYTYNPLTWQFPVLKFFLFLHLVNILEIYYSVSDEQNWRQQVAKKAF